MTFVPPIFGRALHVWGSNLLGLWMMESGGGSLMQESRYVPEARFIPTGCLR
jgi:hypothetical protein